MIKYFECPSGDIIPVKECLEGKCSYPCLTLPTRRFASKSRKWDGKTFSVTQLLQPTLHEYLKIMYPEVVSPMSTLQAGLGTAGHALMEGNIGRGEVGEFRMIDKTGRITGQPDLVDLNHHILYDMKFVSSYSLAMMLGMKSEGYWHEFTRGKRKGQKDWRFHYVKGGEPDYHGYDWQTNMYRLLLKESGIQIDRIILQVTAKESDSALQKLGLDRRSYMIEIPIYDDDVVYKKFYDSYDRLKTALDTKTMPPKCEETWNNDIRCKRYCSVKKSCPYYKKE